MLHTKLTALISGLAMLIVMSGAQASVVYENADTLIGDLDAMVTSFTLSEADFANMDAAEPSILLATLTDFQSPAAFDVLTLAVTSSSKLFGSLDAPGSFSFAPDGPGTYFAHILGDPGGTLDASSFGVKIEWVAMASAITVPVPAAAVLFASGLLFMNLVGRRKKVS